MEKDVKEVTKKSENLPEKKGAWAFGNKERRDSVINIGFARYGEGE